MKKSDQRKMVSFNREQPKSILVRKIGLVGKSLESWEGMLKKSIGWKQKVGKIFI